MIRLLHIPVYQESQESFFANRERRVDKQIALDCKIWHKLGAEHPLRRKKEIQIQVERDWGDWDYRRAVGWVQVTVHYGELETHVFKFRGDIFAWNAKPIYDCVTWREWSFGIGNLDEDNPANKLLESIKDTVKKYFPNRYVELKEVKMLIQAIDWVALMKKSLDIG